MSELDKELLDLLEDDEDIDEGQGGTDAAELKALIDELKRENKGLLKAKQEEKRKRQDNQDRLSRIESALDKVLQARTASDKADAVISAGKKGIPVEFAEDGTAFIPEDKLNEILKPHQQELLKVKEDLESTQVSSEAVAKANELTQRLLSEDERYPAVYNNYLKARDWLNNKVIEFQRDNRVQGKMTGSQALSMVFDPNPEFEDEFKEAFPDMDMDSVLIAPESTRLFRKMLKGSLPKEEVVPKERGTDERFKKVLSKPSGLGSAKNAKSADATVADRLEDLSMDDIMNLDDSKIRALEKAMRDEELRG